MTPEQCLLELQTQKLKRIDDLPIAAGVYALADHLGDLHYIGITISGTFRDRIFSRHVNGSEERSHKLACNYNIGRMWRDRKCADYEPLDAKISKNLRREFIRRHCLASCVSLDLSKAKLEELERGLLHIAPPEMTSWNRTRKRVNRLPEPRDLVDALVEELGLSLNDRSALDRQEALFAVHGDKSLARLHVREIAPTIT